MARTKSNWKERRAEYLREVGREERKVVPKREPGESIEMFARRCGVFVVCIDDLRRAR